MIDNESPLIVAWGGGLNSTAMVVGFYEKGCRPDLILFADTGGEKPETYEYIDVFQAWLRKIGFPDLIVVSKDSMYSSLEDNCVRKEMLPSLAYGMRSCSDKWKRQPQDKYCNHWPQAVAHWKSGYKVLKAIGYDAGEVRRAKIKDDGKYQYWYPLIEWGWYREDCIAAVQRIGLSVPMKSACFYCPASKKAEVIWLRDTHPDLYKRAVDMENLAQANLTTVKGLGRNWSWEELGRMTPVQAEELPDTVRMPCICNDGDDQYEE